MVLISLMMAKGDLESGEDSLFFPLDGGHTSAAVEVAFCLLDEVDHFLRASYTGEADTTVRRRPVKDPKTALG